MEEDLRVQSIYSVGTKSFDRWMCEYLLNKMQKMTSQFCLESTRGEQEIIKQTMNVGSNDRKKQ